MEERERERDKNKEIKGEKKYIERLKLKETARKGERERNIHK